MESSQLSYCIYQHKTYRLVTLFRGSLISLIFDKTLTVDPSKVPESEGVTLMSADIDRIGASLPLIHELYASPMEAGVAIWLLCRIFEVSIIAPLLWVIGNVYSWEGVDTRLTGSSMSCHRISRRLPGWQGSITLA
jgi:hypothetical protein